MATELKMPQMGYDMEEGTVIRWLKEEGSSVSRNEAVAEIETDKAVVEFESEVEGILLSIVATEGSIVPVGETIAVVGAEGEEIIFDSPSPVSESDPQPIQNAEPISVQGSDSETPEIVTSAVLAADRILATPVARKIADEIGLDLLAVSGSGPGGRITKKDVENFDPDQVPGQSIPYDESVVDSLTEPEIEVPAPVESLAPAPVSEVPTSSLPKTDKKEPLTRMRQQIARVTVKSKTEKPHFYVSAEIDMTRAMSLRRQVNEQLSEEGLRITVNDLVVKACVASLKKYPKFNAYYEDDGIQYNDIINIAVAIAEQEGLIVPAIIDCGDKSLRQLSQMIKDLAERSASGTLSPQEYTGGTFAISNLGMFDVTSFVAIIHPPQSAVLAVGTVSEKPVARDGEVSIAQIMTATLSADHRIVDGAEGAQFLIEVKRLLENPMGLVL